MYKNILLPTDGLANCMSGACHGILLAKALGAKITAVYVTRHLTAQEILKTYHEDTPWGASDGKKVQEAIAQAEGSHREEADKALAVAERMCAENGVPCEKVQLADESPADGILRVARQKGCDAIFLSTHGDPGIMRILLGTLASQVLSHSKIAVMVHHCDGPV